MCAQPAENMSVKLRLELCAANIPLGACLLKLVPYVLLRYSAVR